MRLDSFAWHFANHCTKGVKLSNNQKEDDEIPDYLTSKCHKLHEIIQKTELLTLEGKNNISSTAAIKYLVHAGTKQSFTSSSKSTKL